MDVLLGVDVGSTNIKGVAYTSEGRSLSVASRPTPTQYVGLRQAQHDPETLWQEVASVLREVVDALPGHAHVAGMAIASVGEAGVPLDAHGRALYPIIAWYDERSVPQAEWWAKTVGVTEIYQRTGLPLGHTFTLNKLLWLREKELEVFNRISRWLCVADYIAYRLTGEQCMGYSLASRTMALDLRCRRWSTEMLDHAALEASVFPELRPEGSLVGHVTAEAACETGLPKGLPVFVGGHDHICGSLAVGACYPGIVLDSTGTTEAELVTLDAVEEYLGRADLSFCLGCHVVRGRYYAIGSILGAGSMLHWLATLLWSAEGFEREAALQALTQAAGQSVPGAHGLYILPYLAGAGSPERDPTARGLFVGLSLAHTRADIARAAIEGLAYELRLLWEALERFTGQHIVKVISIGGGARNTFWNQVKADVTGRDLEVPEHVEAVTLGAAILAGMGSGIYRDEKDAQKRISISTHRIHPQAENVAFYDGQYRLLMREIRPLATALGRKSVVLYKPA